MVEEDILSKFTSFYTKRESVLTFAILFLSFLNVVFFHDRYIHIPLQIVIILLYFYLTKRKKLTIFYTFLHFSIMFLVTEALIIKLTNKKTLVYNSPHKLFNIVPYWLFSAYLCMTIFIINTYDLYKSII